jgi:hypothetical protein
MRGLPALLQMPKVGPDNFTKIWLAVLAKTKV